MDKTIVALHKLLKLLCREQAKAWYPQRLGKKPSTKAQKAWKRLSDGRHWRLVEETDLKNWFTPSNELHVDFSQRKKVLYLPPLGKNAEFVPVLSLKCNTIGERLSVRLRVMLIRCSEDGDKLFGIGFRMESPESENQIEAGNGKEGLHDFYHAQLIRGFDYGPTIESPCWLPETQPSFPITAVCPVTLILSLLLTLYGKNYCWEFYTNHRTHLGDLKRYMDKLDCWIKWKSFT